MHNVMPILTPERPLKCTTHQMTHSAKHKIVTEFKRASNLALALKNKHKLQGLITTANQKYSVDRQSDGSFSSQNSGKPSRETAELDKDLIRSY